MPWPRDALDCGYLLLGNSCKSARAGSSLARRVAKRERIEGEGYPFPGPMFVLTHEPPDPPDPKVTYLTGDMGEASPRNWTLRAGRT